MFEKFLFYIWHKQIENDLKKDVSPLVGLWILRVELVYKPLFKTCGLRAVFTAHDAYVKKLGEQLEAEKMEAENAD